MEPEPNYLGAAVFWCYIVAALIFTSIAIYAIVTIQPQDDAKGAERRRRSTRVFCGLAGLSFTVLSGNMLHVLIQSFMEWSKLHPSLAADNGLLPAIWKWSITSSLFLDFGYAIVADRARFLWTLSALNVTMAVCVYMGYEGKRRRIPHLYAFFALTQILPVSFAQTLFYLALLRLPSPPPTAPPPELRRFLTDFTLILYFMTIATVGQQAQQWQLIQQILFARLLLLAPRFLPMSGPPGGGANDEEYEGRRIVSRVVGWGTAMTLWHLYPALAYEHSARELGMALFSHPAVSSLGCDFIIGLVSFAVWWGVLWPQQGEEIEIEQRDVKEVS